MATDVEIAWAAGLFEGEGSLSIMNKRNPERPSIQLSLTSTDHDVVVRFTEIVGIGRVYGPYRSDRVDWKPQWNWRAHGWDALRRLYDAWEPWLGQRRRERFDEVLAMRPPKYVQINRASRRFSDAEVRDMRTSYAQGETQVAIGKRYGVAQPHIGEIVRRETYKEIA